MTKVKVFIYGWRRRRGYDNSSLDFRHGELEMSEHTNESTYWQMDWWTDGEENYSLPWLHQ